MDDAGNENGALLVVHRVDDPIVADANAKVVASRELHGSRGPRLDGESVDRTGNTVAEPPLESAVRPRRRRMEPDFVGLGVYSRISAHGTAASRSSRAWRAARLSSR